MPPIEVNMEDEDQTSETELQRSRTMQRENNKEKSSRESMDKGTTMLLNFLSLDSAKSPLLLLL